MLLSHHAASLHIQFTDCLACLYILMVVLSCSLELKLVILRKCWQPIAGHAMASHALTLICQILAFFHQISILYCDGLPTKAYIGGADSAGHSPRTYQSGGRTVSGFLSRKVESHAPLLRRATARRLPNSGLPVLPVGEQERPSIPSTQRLYRRWFWVNTSLPRNALISSIVSLFPPLARHPRHVARRTTFVRGAQPSSLQRGWRHRSQVRRAGTTVPMPGRASALGAK